MASKKAKATASQGVTERLTQKTRRRRDTLQQMHAAALHSPARRNDLSPVIRIQRVPIEALRPASRRVRRSDPAQVERITASLRKFGLCVPILITGERQIVHGHSVVEAARALGIHEVSCVVVDHLSSSEVRSLAIALNRLGERGSWDFEELRVEFEELVELGEDLTASGYELPEIDIICSDDLSETTEKELQSIPAVSANTISRPGDVWILGDHKLAQGDARDRACYTRLMADATARLVLTDEPYNISVRTITSNGDHREFAMASGELSRAEFLEFNLAWMRASSEWLVDGGLISTAIDWRTIDVVMEVAREIGLTHINTCIWAKTNAGQGSLWRSAHEEYPFFKKGSTAHVNNVSLGRHGRWRSNLWTYPGASSLGSDSREGLQFHPTVKPRVLIEDVFLDVTNRGDVVIDCFLGSGTSIIAAEATGRRCRAIEIDSGYCDVSIKRWQEMTGKSAILEQTSQSFTSTGELRSKPDAND